MIWRHIGVFCAGRMLLACCATLVAFGCSREPAPRVLETAYIRGGGVPLRDQLGPSSGLVATLEGGEKVDVLAKRARWVQVRLAGGRIGWVHSQYLATQKIFDRFRQLSGETATLASQGQALIRREANLHLEPGSDTDTFYRLVERDAVEVLEHRAVGRKDRARGGSNATEGGAGSAEESSAGVEISGYEDWFLVRASGGRAGWLRESILDMNVPLDVARYNEGMRIRAWFVLFQEHDNGEVHPWYLWATIRPHPGLPYDYDEIRVFVWNPQKSRYETSYRERKLIGFYPIQVGSRETPAGPFPTFSLQLEDEMGKRFRKNYALDGRLVKPEA